MSRPLPVDYLEGMIIAVSHLLLIFAILNSQVLFTLLPTGSTVRIKQKRP